MLQQSTRLHWHHSRNTPAPVRVRAMHRINTQCCQCCMTSQSIGPPLSQRHVGCCVQDDHCSKSWRQTVLRQAGNILWRCRSAMAMGSFEQLLQARVPVISFTHKQTGAQHHVSLFRRLACGMVQSFVGGPARHSHRAMHACHSDVPAWMLGTSALSSLTAPVDRYDDIE